ncbi:DUF2752 domain-containing protein [Streptomyces sp. C11-1]|uniref:DUF2752 domain-containing protein n=1 Tax=Streptomyces durocortorensis TaxID=2811104 RepID=A0ABY9VUD6_9ACTN|nr:DUF2752 domain-containing protein [Streptomyces durocortorensis]WNF26527.1 DUF2752 domain-containing protein [Streptomyces durocortorensis]
MDASPTPAAAQPPDSDTSPPPGPGPTGPARAEASPPGPGPRTVPPTGCPTPDRARSVPARTGGDGPTRLRRLATPLGILAAVAGAFAYVGTVDPNEPGHYPVCPLLKITGALCPGCGGLRSAHAFIHGDLGAAFSANAVATAGYFLFAVVWVLWLVRAWRGQPLRIRLAPAWWWGVGALLLIFSVVRNLPFGSALAP